MNRFPQVRWLAGPSAAAMARTGEVPGTESPVAVLDAPDVLVAGPGAEPGAADLDAVARGAGLVVLGAGPWSPAMLSLVRERGVDPTPRTEPGALVAVRPTLTDQDLLARVEELEGTVGAHLALAGAASPLLRTATGAVVGAVTEATPGRLAVIAADLREGPSSDALLHNLVTWCAPAPSAGRDLAAAEGQGAVAEPAWARLKDAVGQVQTYQAKDGSVPDPEHHGAVADLVTTIRGAVRELAALFPHDEAYLRAVEADLARWVDDGLGVPDFLDSMLAFQPQRDRVDGLQHLVVFPMYTQNGSPDRHLEAVLVEVIWPDFVADLESGAYSNAMFVPIRFVDFTAGYESNSAVLFPETVAMRSLPTFTWGAIFADREAARFRAVVGAAAETTSLALPPDAARLLTDQALAEQTFVMWDLIHDRTHMRGDLPFDPFMIKQRMPYFLYALEELRCDLTAFRESVTLEGQGVPHARLVQYAVVFDRIFRFAITGSRVRNYDGLGGQLLFAWLHQHHVLHWTDNRLSIDWAGLPAAVLELGRRIEDLYWRSIDRPKIAHWLAAYELVASVVTPHPASTWAKGPDALPLTGPLKEMTDAVLPDEFPLSMFYEALTRRIGDVVASTSGITGASGTAATVAPGTST